MLEQFSIKKELLGSARWTLLMTAVRYGASFVSMIILARALHPDDFGHAALAVSQTALFLLLSQVGFSQAIIGLKELQKSTVDTLFSVSLGLAFVLYSVLFVSAPFLAARYNDPHLATLLRVNGIGLFLALSMAIPSALLQRKLDYKGQAFATTLSSLAGFATTVWYCIDHPSPWALIVPSLVTNLTGALYSFYRTRYLPKLRADGDQLRGSLNFGISAFVSNICNYIASNAVPLILGVSWSKDTLGTYAFAESKYDKPFEICSAVLVGNIFPIFSKLRGQTDRIRSAYMKLVRLSVLSIVPAYILAFFGAPFLVPAIFGARWAVATVPLQILFISMIARALGSAVNSTLYALGLPHVSARIGVARMIGYVAVVSGCLYYHAGVNETCAALVSTETFIIFLYIDAGLRALESSLRELFITLRFPALCNLLLALEYSASIKLLRRHDWLHWPQFLLASFVAASLYGAIVYKQIRSAKLL